MLPRCRHLARYLCFPLGEVWNSCGAKTIASIKTRRAIAAINHRNKGMPSEAASDRDGAASDRGCVYRGSVGRQGRLDGGEAEIARPRQDRAGEDRGMGTGEILADQGLGNVALAEPVEEAIRASRPRIGPVVADAVAIAEEWRCSRCSASIPGIVRISNVRGSPASPAPWSPLERVFRRTGRQLGGDRVETV